jgi:adenosylcobyric acid synthase
LAPNKHKASCIAVLGTGSEVGKSIVVTALCRVFANAGLRVAPFKAQNMSNNSGVTPEGLEMGRAQIVQAEAARIVPHVDMNPVLLKPTSDVGSQVVLLGRAITNSTASEYHHHKEKYFSEACMSLDRLREKYDLIVMEGAGSCAEVNLMPNDIVNLRMAAYAAAPVVLVADIHRGGVFAQIVGTLECLPQNQRDQIAGFIVNRFRGDIDLFTEGARWIEIKTTKPVFGVLPWYTHITIESEDSVAIENPQRVVPEKIVDPAIAVIRIPHISNFNDFDPLSDLSGLTVYFLEKVQDLAAFKAVILPGSKNTRYDLQWLIESGWSEKIAAFVEQGGHVLGICGGYQMMGRWVHDPRGLEGAPGSSPGLSLLPVETVLKAPKTTTLTRFTWDEAQGRGYEIHMGQTTRHAGQPLLRIREQNGQPCDKEDGCVADDVRFMGTYLHGLFDTPAITRRWLAGIGLDHISVSDIPGLTARDAEYDLLAEHFNKYVDVEGIAGSIDLKY